MPPYSQFGSGWGGFGGGFGAPPFWWGTPLGWTDFTMYDYNMNQYLDDNEIADVILDNIEFDPGIPLSDEHKIKIAVSDGIATLSGAVAYPRSKWLAYGDAYWAPGVKDVVNNIEVKVREPRAGMAPVEEGKSKM